MSLARRILLFELLFLIGVFLAASNWNFYLAVTLLFLSSVGIIFLRRKSVFKPGQTFLIIFLSFFTGFFYYNFFFNLSQNQTVVGFGEKLTIEGIITSDPTRNDKYQFLDVKLKKPQRGKIRILTNLSPKFEYGDFLQITGRIEKNEDKYLFPVSFFPEINLIARNQAAPVKSALFDFKNSQIAKFRKFLPQNQAALLAGETFGSKGDFSSELKEAMSKSGTTHIVALSGYNIAILILAVERMLNRFLSRKKRFYVTLAVIVAFVVMVGGEASVVRAAIMGSMILIAEQIGRPHVSLRLIISTALVMTLFNPSLIRYDLGFALSFLSLIGIIYLEPILKKIFKMNGERTSFLSWKENAITTLSAQVMVIPIIIQTFDQFSLTAILSNILILETVPITMFFGFLLAAASSIHFTIGFVIAKISAILLAYQLAIIDIFSKIQIPIPNFAASSLVFTIYYGLIGYLIWRSYAAHNQPLKQTPLDYGK